MPILTLKKSYIKNQQALKLILDFIKKHRTVFLIFSLAFGLRLGFFFMVHPFGPGGDEKLLVNDASGYHQIAVSLLQDGQFPPNDDYQSMLRTIGYPAFVAAVYALSGIHPWMVILVQIALDSLFALLLIRMARLFDLQKAAYLAGVLWAIDPLAIISTNALLSDSLFVWLTLAGFYFLTRYFIEGVRRDLYLNALLLALAAHVRPVGLYLFPVMALVLLYRFYRRQQMKQWLIYGLIFTLIIAPWYVRNKILYHHYFFSISGDYNALILYAGPLYAANQDINMDTAKNVLENRMVEKNATLKKEDGYLFYKKYKRQALNIILSTPLAFIKQSLKGAVRIFFGINRETVMGTVGDSEQRIRVMTSLFEQGPIRTGVLLYNNFSFGNIIYIFFAGGLLFVEYFFALLSIRWFLKDAGQTVFLFWVLTLPVLFFVGISIPIGFTRFRLLITPFYILGAVYGSMPIIALIKRKFKVSKNV